MSEENFMRTYAMRCGRMGKAGFALGNRSSPDETPLHVSFSVEKSDLESANTAKVQVWNLSDASLRILDTKDCVLELKAGYGGNLSLILVGNITAVSTSADNADRLTEIEVVDGRVELRDSYISVSFNGKTSCRALYDYIAGQMGVSVVYAGGLSYPSLPGGFSFVGKARDALQKVAAFCGHRWSLQNQVLQITSPGHYLSSKAYLLGSHTGLIGIPKRISIGSESDAQGVRTGWEVTYLLNGAIGINDVVELRSASAAGRYRVYKVTMDGDNLEGDWMCTAQLVDG